MQANRMTRHRSANLKRRRWPRERRGRGGGTGSGIKDVSAQGAWTLASAVSGRVPAGAQGGMEKDLNTPQETQNQVIPRSSHASKIPESRGSETLEQ